MRKHAPTSSGDYNVSTFPNKKTNKKLPSFLVPTVEVEKGAGLQLWDRLRGDKSDDLKMRKGKMWTL